MDESIAFGVAALLAYLVGTGFWVGATAAVGRFFGLGISEVSVGVGSTLFSTHLGSCRLKFGVVPLGGYTTFRQHQHDDAPDDPRNDSVLYNAPTHVRVAIALSGPLMSLLLGVFLLGISVAFNRGQLAVVPPHDSQIHPCGVGGLQIREDRSTAEGQWRLTRDTGLEFAYRLLTFQALEGWGGFTSFFITTGLLGPVSIAACITSLGVIFLSHGFLNLLPLPILNGGQILIALTEGSLGRKLPEKILIAITYVGLIVYLVFFIRHCWVDGRWLWQNARVFLVIWTVLVFVVPMLLRRKSADDVPDPL